MNKYKFDFDYNQDSIVSAIAKSIKNDSTVLEFGPAYGRLTKYLKEQLNCNVDIVEIDEESGCEAAVYSRQAFVGPVSGDIDNFKWYEALDGQKYDYIIFADVLEHLRYPEEVLKKVLGIIKDEGSILISLPNITHNSILINLYNNSFRYTDTGLLDNTHIKFWGINDFKMMVEKLGYSITNIKPFYLKPENTEQSVFFPNNYKNIELLLSNRAHGDIYQYFIELSKKGVGLSTYDIGDIDLRHVLSVYLDVGQGFSEENKVTYTIFSEKESTIEFVLNEDVNILRIDPLEGKYSRVYMTVQDDQNNFYDYQGTNAISKNDSYYEFITTDPWFIINGPFKKGHTFIIKVLVKDFPVWEIAERFEYSLKNIEQKEFQLVKLNRLLDDCNKKLLEKCEKIRAYENELTVQKLELNRIKSTLDEQINQFNMLEERKKVEIEEAKSQIEILNKTTVGLRQELQILYNQYNDVIRSTSWRLTKPMRLVLDKVKSFRPLFGKGIAKFINLVSKTVRYTQQFGLMATIKKVQSKVKRKGKLKYKQFTPLKLDYGTDNLIVNTNKTVSVVIPTKNGGNDFELLIINLLNQKGFAKIEIVIVDSGSTDSTLKIARRYNSKIIEIKPEEFSHSYSRNLGIASATCDYICVMTQDALPTSDLWLYNLYSALASDKKIAAVSCAEYSRTDSDLYYRAFAWNHYRYLGALNGDVLMSLPDSEDPILIRQNAQLSDITCFAKRETFMKYKYQGGFAEDLDLGLRLIKDGYKLAFLGNEVSIHSHNRDAYYYLKRRFVELVTLNSIFKDQQIINYRYSQVIQEMIFIYYYVSELLEALQNDSEIILLNDFRDKFMAQYHSMRKNCYPQIEKLSDLVKINSVDDKTIDFLKRSLSYYRDIITDNDVKYSGVMIDATEGYLNVVFEFMSECYELVDSELKREFSDCVYKILTSVVGTFFAYSYISSEDDRRAYNDFYKQIGDGV